MTYYSQMLELVFSKLSFESEIKDILQVNNRWLYYFFFLFREVPKQMETETKPKIVKKAPPKTAKEEPKDGEKSEEA